MSKKRKKGGKKFPLQFTNAGQRGSVQISNG